MKILVLEMDEKGKKITETLLEERNDTLIILLNPDDIFRVLEKERFDIIFIPLKINGMDSFELSRNIKRFNPRCILYAYSWHLKLYDPETLERVGFDGFIKRPTKKETLTTALEGAKYRLLRTVKQHQTIVNC